MSKATPPKRSKPPHQKVLATAEEENIHQAHAVPQGLVQAPQQLLKGHFVSVLFGLAFSFCSGKCWACGVNLIPQPQVLEHANPPKAQTNLLKGQRHRAAVPTEPLRQDRLPHVLLGVGLRAVSDSVCQHLPGEEPALGGLQHLAGASGGSLGQGAVHPRGLHRGQAVSVSATSALCELRLRA